MTRVNRIPDPARVYATDVQWTLILQSIIACPENCNSRIGHVSFHQNYINYIIRLIHLMSDIRCTSHTTCFGRMAFDNSF